MNFSFLRFVCEDVRPRARLVLMPHGRGALWSNGRTMGLIDYQICV